jgi:hypothetical protein
MKSRRAAAVSVVLGASLFVTRVSHAEVSSWLYLGLGGAGLSGHGVTSPRVAMQLDTGVGTSPHRAIVVGGGARLLPYFGEGTDFAAYLRGATQGYVLGRFGAAVDVGAYAGAGDARHKGFLGTLNVGLPWGVVASGSYAMAGEGEKALTVTLGIDFLRLTVYRLSGEKQWPNVMPAYRPDPAPPPGGSRAPETSPGGVSY